MESLENPHQPGQGPMHQPLPAQALQPEQQGLTILQPWQGPHQWDDWQQDGLIHKPDPFP